MNRGSLLKKKALFTNTALLGIFLMIVGCTKVDVRVSGFCCSSPEVIPPALSCDLPEKFLPIVGFQQETTKWCWAANAQMVTNYLRGNSLQQCEIVNRDLSPPRNCCESQQAKESFECNQPGFPEVALEKVDIISATPIKNPPREKFWGMITSQICEGKPLILADYWEFGGHSSIIYGFDGNIEGAERFVWSYDPQDDPNNSLLTGQVQGGMEWNFDLAIYFASPDTDFYDRKEIYVTEGFNYEGN